MENKILEIESRLLQLEAHQHAILRLMFSAIASHPNPQAWRETFAEQCRQLEPFWIGSGFPDEWFDAATGLCHNFSTALKQNIPTPG